MENLSRWWRGDWLRFVSAIAATVYFLYYVSSAGEWHFIDYIDLIFHEAGHFIFSPFGQFIGVSGGSFFQVCFPLIYVGYFYWRRDYYSGSILLFWVGQNLISVSVYAADAQKMLLPLLGGDSVIHDWNYILTNTHLIQYTSQIASCINGLGVTVILIAAAASIYFSQQNQPEDTTRRFI